jgi:hypothetical protein
MAPGGLDSNWQEGWNSAEANVTGQANTTGTYEVDGYGYGSYGPESGWVYLGSDYNQTFVQAQTVTVNIQIQNGFVSQAGNGLVLLGGPGGLTTTAITASGSPQGGNVVWTPGPFLQVNGIYSVNASVSGTSASSQAGDTYLSVQYTYNGQSAGASVRFTVLDPRTYGPSSMGGSAVPYNSGNSSG